MKFEFMKEHAKEFSIEKMAEVLRVCRSGYYKFLKRVPSKRDLKNEELIGKIKEVHQASRRTYGSPRIHKVLEALGEKCSRKRTAKLMRRAQIKAKMRKKWVVTTTPSREKKEPVPNHLDQNFIVEAPNKVWVSDITYVATEEGWLYVATVMDLFSRKIVGLSMGSRLETELVVKALHQALYRRGKPKGVMHHSDRGSQYTSKEFKDMADEYGMRLSMSGKGRCYDNAVAESFFHTLKTEHVHLCKYKSREEGMTSIFEYVEVFYNRERVHSTMGYVSPEEFEKNWQMKITRELCS